ncbi:MAG TPA: alkaline phosphatase family protein [Terriglobales bacterium]|nr:alkaline phosphatase family protein [Terriglobales bacterium]
MPRPRVDVVVCCLISLLLIILCGCGGGGSSSSFPTGSVQLSVQAAGGGGGTISSTPPGINCGQNCTANFSSGTQVTLTASPAANSFFAGWSGSCSGTGVCQLTVTQNTSVMANFSTSPVLTVSLSGTGQGSVTSSPSGINCGQTCSAPFNPGTSVTLTATAGVNSMFAGWTGTNNCSSNPTCVVTVNASEKVTATFNPVQGTALLSVALAGSGSGTVTSNPAGINCGTTCTAPFNTGTPVTLTETPAQNSIFAGWSVSSCGNNSTCVVTLSANDNVTATFNIMQSAPVLTVVLAGTGTGTVTSSPTGINCPQQCSASFATGTQVTLTETPTGSSTFAGWSVSSCGTNPTCMVTMNANQQVIATFSGPQNINVLNHIVFLAQENRSFDHYFGALREYWAQNGYPDQAIDGLPQFNPGGQPPTNPGCNPNDPPPHNCVFDPNNPVTSYHLITQCIETPAPLWNESHVDWDYYDPVGLKPATMNGFVWTAAFYARTKFGQPFYDVNGIRAMGYYDGGDLNYYYFMASNFATSDRFFSPVMTRTSPNREYLVAATSQGYAYPVGTDQQDSQLLTATTIFQELQAKGVSWKIYVDPVNSKCSGPPYDPACLLTLSYIQNFKWGQTIPTQYPNNIGTIGFDGADYENDLKNGTLPAVAQIEPATDAGFDEHPSDFDTVPNYMQHGANYVATRIINELMASSSWKDSAFILTFDEFGGLYDHVPPYNTVSPDGIKPVDLRPFDICAQTTGPICDFTYTGYRVPLIVVSPYTQKNYVSHTPADLTAILKFIETRFDLNPLTARDAAQMDMTEFFDFNNPVWLTPPTPPTQNINNPCYLDHLP